MLKIFFKVSLQIFFDFSKFSSFFRLPYIFHLKLPLIASHTLQIFSLKYKTILQQVKEYRKSWKISFVILLYDMRSKIYFPLWKSKKVENFKKTTKKFRWNFDKNFWHYRKRLNQIFIIYKRKFKIQTPLEVIEVARGRQNSHFSGHQELTESVIIKN